MASRELTRTQWSEWLEPIGVRGAAIRTYTPSVCESIMTVVQNAEH